MVTTLYLVRHGETVGSGEKRYHGSLDVPLSDNGLQQVRRTAELIAGHLQSSAPAKYLSYLKDIHEDTGMQQHDGNPPDCLLRAVYCSNLDRARKSAEIIAAPHNLDPVDVPELRERHFGIWEGMSFIEIKNVYPREFEAWAGDPLKYSPPGGESTLEVKDRVIPALERILAGHQGDNISIVAHGGVNRIILCHILGIPLENIFRIEQDYAGLNIIEFWDRYPVIKLLNGGKQ